ncbi:NUDIX domain-containing protein [Citricoccus sp. SGAir0253]|uniref:NUDIX hydrolase n=1 Tax=Citricoccus sp. SGAir0253 TaxID=2567881 RepID=UPI0010CCCA73|nr:NUDIX domain-containing protein [Citricoccus sp. SGAir0253]QCU77619.1 NUDIX domain-containing protein [Citricoccus sp. SGAir0253]
MDFDTRVGAYGVIVRDDTLLLSLWDGPVEALWTLPGGGMELGEQPEQACVREIEEETGYRARLQGLVGVTSRTIDGAHRATHPGRPLLAVQVIYRAEVVSGVLRPEVGGSSIDAAWIPLDELHRHRTSQNVHRALELAGVGR